MNTANPNNPSDKDEESDDLIAELARLVAADAQKKTAPEAGSEPESAAPAQPERPNPFDRLGQNAEPAREPEPEPEDTDADEPTAEREPFQDLAGDSHAEDSAEPAEPEPEPAPQVTAHKPEPAPEPTPEPFSALRPDTAPKPETSASQEPPAAPSVSPETPSHSEPETVPVGFRGSMSTDKSSDRETSGERREPTLDRPVTSSTPSVSTPPQPASQSGEGISPFRTREMPKKPAVEPRVTLADLGLDQGDASGATSDDGPGDAPEQRQEPRLGAEPTEKPAPSVSLGGSAYAPPPNPFKRDTVNRVEPTLGGKAEDPKPEPHADAPPRSDISSRDNAAQDSAAQDDGADEPAPMDDIPAVMALGDDPIANLIAESEPEDEPEAPAPATHAPLEPNFAQSPAAAPVPKPEPRVEAKPESRPEPKPEPRPEPRIDTPKPPAEEPKQPDWAAGQADQDRFDQAPGLRGSIDDPATAPESSSDPLSEIERLIAETTAVDFNSDSGTQTPAAPSEQRPASEASRASVAPLRELGGVGGKPQGAAPTTSRSAGEGLDAESQAAEAAIFASIANSARDEGAGKGIGEGPRAKPRKVKDSRSGGVGRFIVPAAAGLLIVALLGGGAYWYFGMSGDEGEAPIITAQNTAIKEDPPTEDTPDDSSIVFDQLAGDTSDDAGDEQIVSRDETGGASGNDVSRVISPSSTSSGGLANRKVKTVTVRADGTIVASDESSAGVEPLPAVRPNVPEVPGATSEEDGDADSIGAVLQALNGDGEVPDLTGLSGEGSDTSAAARALDATPDEATETAANDDPNAPVPLPRPTGLERPELSLASRQASVNTSTGNNASTSSGSSRPTPTIIRPPSSSSSSSASSGSSTSTASNSAPVSLDGGSSTSQPAPTPSPTLTPVSPDSAPYFVQLSSQRSEAAARESAGALSRRFSSQLAGVNLAIQRVDLPERGTFFRVKVPTANQSQASALCNSIKSAGGDCFVTEQ